jgi:hypothetical protein
VEEVTQVGTAPSFASTDEALDMARAALGYLAAADATQLGTAAQARSLKAFEQANAIATAARASFLAAFTGGQGYADDAAYSARAWLIHQTHVTSGAAVGHTAWAKRARTHPRVLAALAAGQVSESVGRLICLWTDRLPEHLRDQSDELLVAAAQAGLGTGELAAMAAQMYENARSELPDEDPDAAFKDRSLKLATTFGGAGVIHGDLTPECAEVVGQAAANTWVAPAESERAGPSALTLTLALLPLRFTPEVPSCQRVIDHSAVRFSLTGKALLRISGAMLETCGSAGKGVYLPGDLVEVSSKIGGATPVGKVQPDAHRSP